MINNLVYAIIEEYPANINCSKLAIKTLERRQLHRSDVFIVNFECISHQFFSVLIIDFEQANICWVMGMVSIYCQGRSQDSRKYIIWRIVKSH